MQRYVWLPPFQSADWDDVDAYGTQAVKKAVTALACIATWHRAGTMLLGCLPRTLNPDDTPDLVSECRCRSRA
jgi:hypothetical protein